MKLIKRIATWTALALALGTVLYLSFAERAVRVSLAEVREGELVVTLDEEGTTRVRERHLVLAPLDGMLHRLELHPGDAVAAGATPVATVEPLAPGLLDERSIAMAEARVGAVMAALERAEQRVLAAERLRRSAQEELDRQEAAGSAVSVKAVAQAERELLFRDSELTVAQADIAVAKQELAEARAALLRARPHAEGATSPPDQEGQSLTVHSPISGKVLRVLRESAGPVRIGDPLAELGDTGQLEIVADYLTADAVRIAPGMQAIIDRWGGDAVLSARVRTVEPSAFTKVSSLGIEEQRVNVILDLITEDDAPVPLGDGFRVQVRVVQWSGTQVLLVPESALFKGTDGWAVFRRAGKRSERCPVTLGHRDGRHAEVLDGLAPGDLVVEYPGERLEDGTRIDFDPVQPRPRN